MALLDEENEAVDYGLELSIGKKVGVGIFANDAEIPADAVSYLEVHFVGCVWGSFETT